MKHITNIEWDLDEEDYDFLHPNEWNVPDSIPDDEIADYLTDQFGFFVISYVKE